MNRVDLKQMHFISLVWGGILFLIVIALTLFGFYFKYRTKVYKDYESILEEKTKEYLLSHPVSYENSYSLEELINLGVIEEAKVSENACEGYVSVLYQNDIYQTDAYIKCGIYKTRGYGEF